MQYNHIRQSRIPACTLDEALFSDLWDLFSQDGEFLWHATIGIGGDLLGKEEERPVQTVKDWQEIISLVKLLPRIDQFSLTVEIENKGTIAFAFKNFVPVGGKLIVTGREEGWTEERFEQIMGFLESRKKGFNTFIYTRLGFEIIQTVIPLSSMFIFVMLLAGLLIPSSIRHSGWLWWITAGTMVVTLRLAYTLSDKLIVYFLGKYPYIKWNEHV